MILRVTLIFLFGMQIFATASAIENLSKLSLNERAQLRTFFRKGVEVDGLGYVLFFDTKPMSMYPVTKRMKGSYRSYIAAKGWEVWKKYEHLFPHPNYIICEEIAPFSHEILHIFVINKATLRKSLNSHYEEFKAVLGDSFSIDSFLRELEDKKHIRPLIKNDEMLLGIMFGYGKESALNCKVYKENKKNDGNNKLQPIPPISKKQIICKGRYSTHIKGGGIGAVRWSGDPNSSEVRALIKEYRAEQMMLKRIYRRKDFLKISLKKLCDFDNHVDCQSKSDSVPNLCSQSAYSTLFCSRITFTLILPG